MKIKKRKGKPIEEIKDYDEFDATAFIDRDKELKFEDTGLKLPKAPPTEVVSIRLPVSLLNELRALGSERDIPYQALIKLFLSDSVKKLKKKESA